MVQNNTIDAAQLAANFEVDLRGQRVDRFIQVAASSNINISQSDFANIRDVREGVVFKESTVRNMVGGGTWVPPSNVLNIFSLRADVNMNSDQVQNDRSIIVRGVGLMINPDCDYADLQKILQYGYVRIHSPNSDYLDYIAPLEDVVCNPLIQVSQITNKTASANGDGKTAYEFLRSRGQGKFNPLPQPLLVEKNSKATMTIEGIPGQTVTAVTLQAVLICDYPII